MDTYAITYHGFKPVKVEAYDVSEALTLAFEYLRCWGHTVNTACPIIEVLP